MFNKLLLPFVLIVIFSLLAAWLVVSATSRQSTPGVYPDRIVFGSVLPLQGELAAPGLRMENGLRLAFENVEVHGRRIELLARNDYYDRQRSAQETQALIDQGIFAMIGNVGERNAEASLPLLEKADVPSVAFLDGSDVSFTPRPLHFQFRPSFQQEVQRMLQALFNQGVKPENICAYVQQDVSGLSVLRGIRAGLGRESSNSALLAAWDNVLRAGEQGAENWNNLGPVGSYQLSKTLEVSSGFHSLQQWESQGNRCLVVMTYGFELNLGNFIRHSLAQNKPWVFTSLSFSGAKRMNSQFKNYGIRPVLYMSQVVPLIQSDLPIVKELRSLDIPEMTNINLEGYIVGKMIIAALEQTPTLTRDDFIKTLRNINMDLGGVALNAPANQGERASDLILITRLQNDGTWHTATDADWQDLRSRLAASTSTR